MASGRTTLVLCAFLASATAGADTVSDTTRERASSSSDSRPTLTPGRVPPLPSSALPVARGRFRDGDYQGTISTLSSWILDAGTPWSTTRQVTHFLLGMAHFAVGNWNLASSNFTKVRIMDGPLAAHAAWYEARSDHRRGRSTVAALECEGYRKTWPNGPHFDACLLLSAHAYNTSGQHSKAADAYDSWLQQNPDSPKSEEVSLARALVLTHTQPERSVVLLRELVDHHRFHATAVTALATLEELGESVDEAPRSVTTLVARCESALACGRHDRAWDLLSDIRALSPDSRTARQWVSENELRVAWTTRRFSDYQQIATIRYEASPNGDDAWRIFKALRRSGDWTEAVTWGRQSMRRHGSHWRWQRARDDLAWAEMRAGELSSARDRWKPLGRLYGHSGRDARFYHAFSAYLMGDHEAAEVDFTELTETGKEWRAAAHYWRAKSREVRGDNQGAASDRELARKLDYTGWYRLLLTSNSNFLESSENWGMRDGTWNGPGTTQLPSWSSSSTLIDLSFLSQMGAIQPLKPMIETYRQQIDCTYTQYPPIASCELRV
ncbi:MAG: hypothetical protein QGG40_06215, partial [Myxococcota bacterium]|nr:hypothetical protein [Myxococcota bacterium]